MAENLAEIPKKIKIIVNKAEDLELYHPRKVIRHQPKKWRVLFLNVEEKMATAKVTSDDGNPEWLCEITVTSKNVQEPISLLVTDSKSHHIGQVIIQLNQIPSLPSNCISGTRPPLLFSNIVKSELEPTKRNAYPKGYLYYWIWAVEYWKLNEIIAIKSKKSLSKSIHLLSNSTFNMFRQKKSITSLQESEVCPDNIGKHQSTHLKTSLKLKILKKKLKGDNDFSSTVNSHIVAQNSTVNNGFYSKNPFDAMTTTDIYIENVIQQEEPYTPSLDYSKSPSHSHQPSLHHQVSIGSKCSPVSNKKKNGLFAKFQFYKSQSTADLSKVSSDKDHPTELYFIPQSQGKEKCQNIYNHETDKTKSSTKISSWYCGETFIPTNDNQVSTRAQRRLSRPQSCLIHNLNSKIPNFDYDASALSYNSGLHKQADIYIKNLNVNRHEEKTKRELIDLLITLENKLIEVTEKYKIGEKQAEKLHMEKKDLQDDLNIVKDELCKLKLRLLEAGDTKYLEKIELRSPAEMLTDLTFWRTDNKI